MICGTWKSVKIVIRNEPRVIEPHENVNHCYFDNFNFGNFIKSLILWSRDYFSWNFSILDGLSLPQSLPGGTPVLGYPLAKTEVSATQDWGTPSQKEHWTKAVVPPQKGYGTRVWGRDWEPDSSTPPPPLGVNRLQTLPCPILWMQVVKYGALMGHFSENLLVKQLVASSNLNSYFQKWWN